MYLHLGEDTVVKEDEIIGVFDIENTSIGRYTKEFLDNAQKQSRIVNVSYEMPKSFIVCSDKVFISQISVATLRKRAAKPIYSTSPHKNKENTD